MEFIEKIKESADFISSKLTVKPEIAIIFGSGISALGEIRDYVEIPYSEIPHFPVSTVKGHAGKLIVGAVNGVNVLIMAGRFHYYEGYSMKEITFPIYVFKQLGVHTLIVTNAAGAVNPKFRQGDIMLIVDHINLLPDNPLRGPNDERLGPRFPSMHEPYSRELVELAERKASTMGISLQRGVYVAIAGPTLETPAEYRMARILGGDADGMSTVPEVIVANYLSMKVLGFSIITNVADPYNPQPTTHEEVIEVAGKASQKLGALIAALLPEIKS